MYKRTTNVDNVAISHGTSTDVVRRLNISASDLYYCGGKRTICRCGNCRGEKCGPDKGCPCDACYAQYKIKQSNGQYGRNMASNYVFPGDKGKRGFDGRRADKTLYCGVVYKNKACFCNDSGDGIGKYCGNRCGPSSGCPCQPCAIAQLKKETDQNNSKGFPVWKGIGKTNGGITNRKPSDLFYCGQTRGPCFCRRCGDVCGPSKGCPCISCLQLVNEHVNDILVQLAHVHNIEGMTELLDNGCYGEINATTSTGNWTALAFACKLGNSSLVNSLLSKEGIDVNAMNSDKMTPLHIAAKMGCLDIVKSLVEAGAEIDCRNTYRETPIDTASHFGNTEVVDFLKDHFRPKENSRLQNLEIAILRSTFCRHDTSSCGKVLELITTESNIVNSILSDGNTPLGLAIICGAVDLVLLLIKNYAHLEQPSQHGETPLYLAAKHCHLSIVHLLLEKKVIRNTVNPCEMNWTPLHVAAKANNKEIVLALLNAGANPLLESSEAKRAVDYATEPELKRILEKWTNRIEFDTITCDIIIKSDATIEDLQCLAREVTDVNDLGILYSIINTILSEKDLNTLKPVLQSAVNFVIKEKLVVDDTDLVFFKRVLLRCKERGMLNESEYLLYKHQATKVNFLHSEDMTKLARQVQENTWRIRAVELRMDNVENNQKDLVRAHNQLQAMVTNLSHNMKDLRQAFVQNQEREENMNQQRRKLGFVSMALFILGGTIIREIGEHVIDISNPVELVKFAVEPGHLTNFANAAWDEVDLKGIVKDALEEIALPKQEFITSLQTCIRYNADWNHADRGAEVAPLTTPIEAPPQTKAEYTESNPEIMDAALA